MPNSRAVADTDRRLTKRSHTIRARTTSRCSVFKPLLNSRSRRSSSSPSTTPGIPGTLPPPLHAARGDHGRSTVERNLCARALAALRRTAGQVAARGFAWRVGVRCAPLGARPKGPFPKECHRLPLSCGSTWSRWASTPHPWARDPVRVEHMFHASGEVRRNAHALAVDHRTAAYFTGLALECLIYGHPTRHMQCVVQTAVANCGQRSARRGWRARRDAQARVR